jgi:hypothetical protein
MEKGSFMDYGMFIQSIMLSAIEHGLANTLIELELSQFEIELLEEQL